MPKQEHMELTVFHRRLADKVHAKHGNRCPCCRRVMNDRKVRMGRSTPRDKRTVGHNVAVAFGGNPEVWVYICHGCNNEQATRSFADWGRYLVSKFDERGDAVCQLAELIEFWCALHKVELAIKPLKGRQTYTLSLLQLEILDALVLQERLWWEALVAKARKAMRKLLTFGYVKSPERGVFILTDEGRAAWSAYRGDERPSALEVING
jgi:hypothetical protein